MIELVIDGREVGTLDRLHDLFAASMAFPACYGRNLDALYDCLTDLREDATVRLTHREALAASIGRRAEVLAVLLRRASEENPRLTFVESDG